ncbi:MAG: NUDIX domain-containing protein [Firmicutes bacterium]|nr:NUDIX domain-containing protein [Bacillota bacterium]
MCRKNRDQGANIASPIRCIVAEEGAYASIEKKEEYRGLFGSGKTIYNREELILRMKCAEKRIDILGAIACRIPYREFQENWFSGISRGVFEVNIFCESSLQMNYDGLISLEQEVSGFMSRSVEDYENIAKLTKEWTRDYFVAERTKQEVKASKGEALTKLTKMHLEPQEDGRKIWKKEMQKKYEATLKTEYEECLRGGWDATGGYAGWLKDQKKDAEWKDAGYGRNEGEVPGVSYVEEKQCFSLRICYLPIKIPLVRIDNEYFMGLALTKFDEIGQFEKIDKSHAWWEVIQKYGKAFFEDKRGAKKYCTEYTELADRLEVIGYYDQGRHYLGTLPRDAHLDGNTNKVVVWGIVFSRDGRILIHQRKGNAKDNQGMWDKSFGGHVDNDKDVVDTVKAAAREMLEEFNKVEQAMQGGHDKVEDFVPNENKPIFLGEWRKEIKSAVSVEELLKNKGEYYFFRIGYEYSKRYIVSKRLLGDGEIQETRCFADVYAFIAPDHLDINKLKNSAYRLIETGELYGEVYAHRKDGMHTHDLHTIVGEKALWREIIDIKGYLKKEQ